MPDTAARLSPDRFRHARLALERLARTAATRAVSEANATAALWRSGAVGVDLPHRMLPAAGALVRTGPVGAAIALPTGRFPDRVAVVDERGPVTFAELDALARRLAGALAARGVGSDDTVAVMCRNHRGMLVALFAGTVLGARTVLLNTDFAGPQLRDVLTREEVTAVVADAEFDERTAGLDTPGGRVLLPHATDDGGVTTGHDDLFDETAAHPPAPRPTRRQRLVLLTGGTTGTPKGAPRDFGTTLAIPGGYLEKIPLRSGRTAMVLCPVFHAWGLLSTVLALTVGDTLLLRRAFDADAAAATIAADRVDTVIAVPVLLSRLLDAVTAHGVDTSSVRVVAVSGSALSTDLARRAREVLGDVVHNLYGSTEVAFVTIATPADLAAAPGTVGRAPTGTTVAILGDDDRSVPTGGTGRIFVANTIHFEGYTGGGSKDQVGGMMTTGDLGHLDANGRLFIDGRSDDMIVSGGENVFPGEVEDLLLGHDEVSDAAVVGVEDDDFGQRLRAYVVTSAGSALDEDAVKAYVKENLARYKVPREVRFVDDLPRNQAGKIVKRELDAD
ncbi:AMP-binding protein [Jatrophihabitans sp. YIM 134969]